MKKVNLVYWISTGLLAALMLFSSIPNIMSTKESVELITNHLRYPAYVIPFLGVAKLLGVIALLVPGFHKIREWAYAGFVFDLAGAMYSSIAVGDPPGSWMMLFIGFALIAVSYIFHHKKLKAVSVAMAG